MVDFSKARFEWAAVLEIERLLTTQKVLLSQALLGNQVSSNSVRFNFIRELFLLSELSCLMLSSSPQLVPNPFQPIGLPLQKVLLFLSMLVNLESPLSLQSVL
ncbi:hypothetical protein FGO68_gene6827 [Halteria grandinella]|uniref:Uncharacterized protein n=1 Tax=Halteria grandinella TaxID=5974 RepID=A0A8J8P0S0_HALGN|nr:hypothetical protein FGO68_gene6827 [Halteria grandinella]